MTKKENISNGSISLGEIGTIRNILMGEQINQYEEKFRQLEAELALVKADLQEQIKAEKSNSSQAIEIFKKEILAQISNLSNEVNQKNAALEQHIANSNQAQKTMLGKLFMEFGQKMMEA